MPRSGPMPVVSSNSAGDLRSHAQDRKRDKEAKTKWSPRWAATGLPVAKEGLNDKVRPRNLRSVRLLAYKASLEQMSDRSRRTVEASVDHSDNTRRRNKAHKSGKRPALAEDSASPDTSTDDDVELPSNDDVQETEPDTYQPCDVRGDKVLEMALDKAVEEYEDKQTARLVDDEYEVLPYATDTHKSSIATDLDDDDGFELV